MFVLLKSEHVSWVLRIMVKWDLLCLLDETYFLQFNLPVGCTGYRLSSQYVVIPPESESKGSHCWMVISINLFPFIFCHCYLNAG